MNRAYGWIAARVLIDSKGLNPFFLTEKGFVNQFEDFVPDF